MRCVCLHSTFGSTSEGESKTEEEVMGALAAGVSRHNEQHMQSVDHSYVASNVNNVKKYGKHMQTNII